MTQKKDKGRGRFPPQAPGKEVCLEIGDNSQDSLDSGEMQKVRTPD